MTLRRLDQSKPPPGWTLGCTNTARGVDIVRKETVLDSCGKGHIVHVVHEELSTAHVIEASNALPWVNDTLAQLVEWLRESPGMDTCSRQVIADVIESGEWRR